jgi:dipeptidyl aminopeptidase/acylaminoacyl peptidase
LPLTQILSLLFNGIKNKFPDMKLRSKLFWLLFLIPIVSAAQSNLDTLSLKSIFYEPLLAGNRPNFTAFSPDLSHIYYQTNDSSMIDEELFRVALSGKKTEPAPEKAETEFSVSPDGKKLLYLDHGDIWLADLHFDHKRKLIETNAQEYNAIWGPNSRRIAFIQEGNVWTINVVNSKLTQVTDKKEEETGYNVVGWAGDNKLVLSQYDTSDYKEYYFPTYLGEYVKPGATRRGVARHIISVAYLDSSKTKSLFEKKGYLDTSISASGDYVAIDSQDPPMKHRSIKVFDIEHNSTNEVFRDSTDGWLYGTNMAFAPGGDKLMFQSEKDGWNHIYTVDPDGEELHQHTHGSYDIPWARWISGDKIVFASSEVDPGIRELYSLNIQNDEIKQLTSKPGYRQHFSLSRDKRHLVYQYSYFNIPFELYTIDLKRPRKEVRLTQTTPDRFFSINWQKEDYIRFTARDGKTKLSMSVLEPLHKREGEKYPVVVFVHGAGSLQNVYQGWSDHYYREYMFNQYLNTHGYYVIEVDYRHSTGYGRKFREDVTNWMGKYETRDIVDGIDYLAAHYEQADTSRVGIYGGSYGGFMSLYATSVKPSYFDCAAALRAVTNWENYYHTNPWYTMPRLGKPETDSVNYARSSPITYVEQLKRPVLILHGLKDNNVGFQDAAQYINKLIQTGGKDFQMMMYPAERHSFQDPDNWYDEYSRIYHFMNEHLKTNNNQIWNAESSK